MPQRRQTTAILAAKHQEAPGIVRLVLRLPEGHADCVAGQFLMIKPADGRGPLLRRPFGIMAVDDAGLHLLFDVKGLGTQALADTPVGGRLEVITPLGEGFPLPDAGHRAVLVAGGLGLPPLIAFATRLKDEGIAFDLVYGSTTASQLVMTDRVRALCPGAIFCTDDGSNGTKGLVTQNLPAVDGPALYYAVGPTPMMKAVADTVAPARCIVSLEERMACGVGVCMGCVTPVRTADGGRATKRVCVEGPIFDAAELLWDWSAW